MKMKFIAACVAACAAVPAVAAPLTGPFDTPDVTIYLSGASAPDNFLAGIAGSLFNGAQGAQWYAFADDTAETDGSYKANKARAFFGEIKQSDANDVPAALVGKKVLLIKRSAGGSVFGVNPVARAESLAVLNVSSSACNPISGSFNYKCPIVGADFGVGGKVPDFGVSDVSPAMFKGPYNVEFGKTQLDSTEVTNLTIKGVNTLAMGLAVTNTVPATTYLSKADYAAMLSAGIYDWTTLGVTVMKANGSAPSGKQQVVVCRRTPGSGTQASYNWFFNNFPCTTDSIAGTGSTTPAARMSDSAGYRTSGNGSVATPYVIDVAQGFTVIENQGSGDVRNCLAKAAAGGVHTFKDEEGKEYMVDFGSATDGTGGGYGAIGVLSVDSLDKTGNASNKWSYRAIDGAGMYYDSNPGASTTAQPMLNVTPTTTGTTGVHPSKQNLIDGKYEFAAELTMQYRTDLTGLKKDFADLFIKRAGEPTYNTSAWVAALPIDYNPTETADVAKATRYGNMCAPLQRSF